MKSFPLLPWLALIGEAVAIATSVIVNELRDPAPRVRQPAHR